MQDGGVSADERLKVTIRFLILAADLAVSLQFLSFGVASWTADAGPLPASALGVLGPAVVTDTEEGAPSSAEPSSTTC